MIFSYVCGHTLVRFMHTCPCDVLSVPSLNFIKPSCNGLFFGLQFEIVCIFKQTNKIKMMTMGKICDWVHYKISLLCTVHWNVLLLSHYTKSYAVHSQKSISNNWKSYISYACSDLIKWAHGKLKLSLTQCVPNVEHISKFAYFLRINRYNFQMLLAYFQAHETLYNRNALTFYD